MPIFRNIGFTRSWRNEISGIFDGRRFTVVSMVGHRIGKVKVQAVDNVGSATLELPFQ